MTFLPAGRSSISTPGSVVLVSGSGSVEPQPSLAAGEERRRDLGEVAPAPSRTSRRSGARPSRSARAAASRARRGDASRSVRCVESSTSRSFSASYSSFASGFTRPSASRRRSSRSSFAASSSRSSPSAGSAPACLEAAPRLVRLGARAARARRRSPSRAWRCSACSRRSSASSAPRRRSSAASSPDFAPPTSARARSGASKRHASTSSDATRRCCECGEPRNRGVGRGRVRRRWDRRLGARARSSSSSVCERTAPRLELEQDGLRRLAREPQLAARRVVAESLARHGRNRATTGAPPSQRPAGRRLARLDDHGERAEPRRAGTLEQSERGADVVGDERRRALAQRRGDRALHPRLDVEQRQREPLALLRERPSGRRKSLALGERALERREPLLEQTYALGERLALGPDALVEHATRLLELGAKARQQTVRRLATQRDPLARAPQAVERRGRLLALPRGVGQLVLDAIPFGRAAPRASNRRPAGRARRPGAAPRPRRAARRSPRGRAARCVRAGGRARRRASPRAPRPTPAMRAGAAACEPPPRRRARARPASRHGRASTPHGGGAP